MASFKTSKNLLQSRSEYSRYFTGFRGVDFSSDHTEVNDSRFAYAINMYKDYKSGQGNAVETIPGFRKVFHRLGRIFGIHVGLENKKMFVHIENILLYVADIDENQQTTMLDEPIKIYQGVAQRKSTSFFFGEKIYILDGKHFLSIDADLNVENVRDSAYIPTTYISIDPGAQNDSNAEDYGQGEEHEQRNILTPKFKTTFLADGKVTEFPLKNKIDMGEFSSCVMLLGTEARFPSDFANHTYVEVYQYGVKLPYAVLNREVPSPSGGKMLLYGPPEGYPNAIVSIDNDGVITLVDPPPAPENNTWNPNKQDFDYDAETIEAFLAGELEEPHGIFNYEWPYAYASGSDGIEVVVKKKITAISGIEPEGDGADIIEKCTIATIFDNRVFLSGNPRYPKHIFWSGVVKDTGRPDPSYFGILNYDQEGVSDAPVVAMLPVADTLMVLKRDAEGEGSVLFHTPTSTGYNVNPRAYPATQGLAGVGCHGPCINFRDDPIFISRFGVEAMGQLSVRYERAIEHRSSLVDAKLLNCNLSKASVAEWEGYLLVLCEGKIFMADSRQMFTHQLGNNQYEWFYLEDIGIYSGQIQEYVFSELPVEITSEELAALTGGVEILEATAVNDTFGKAESLIAQPANANGEKIKFLSTTDGNTVYYRELPVRDNFGRETGEVKKYYVEPSGAWTGGEFKPATMLKVVGGDIFFATDEDMICKFNFDMRDKETGVIPNEAYDFDGRTIFSAIATKMDNCGIPHLTKNTVKRSTVIKAPTFKHSAAKVKVRTNKKAFRQVGRIINGRATFEDTDFMDFTFSTEEKNIFSINEKEKKWMEKQYFIYSNEFRRPFAIHYLAYRYNVAGRYKE